MAITELPPSPDGEITHGDVALKINEIIQNVPLVGGLVNFTTSIVAYDFTQQTPTGLDTPYQIKFGTAQTQTDFDLSAAGAFTCNVSGVYKLSVIAQATRSGTSGTVWLYFRALVNGAQVGASLLVKIGSLNDDQPILIYPSIPLSATDVLTFEFIRGSEGVNEGFLEAATPAIGGWADVPSASIAIEKLIIA